MSTQDKMDMRSWKKVLLQWVIECRFVERNYFNLEQSDIDGFYAEFSQRHSGLRNNEGSITSFLSKFYPDYEAHLDDENALSATDYIYVYSLLLHFSCVQQPEEYFHEICQKLGGYYQQRIASFFKGLLETKCLNKDYLRRVIANVSVESPSSSETSGSSNTSVGSCSSSTHAKEISSNNSSSSSIKTSHTELAVTRRDGIIMRTPTRQGIDGAAQRPSPSTPKTFLLDERTRDLYNLRAQLETERYEKGLLEVQIKQSEEKIHKLNQDHKKLQQQIKDLKNDILRRNTECDQEQEATGGEGSDHQLKRRLYKEINQKEEEIARLADLLNASSEEKTLINEKLVYAQKQIIVSMERIKELDYKVDELRSEKDQKEHEIQYLQETKKDLEHFITEMRASAHAQLDTSIECGDMSFSRTTNSSCSTSSPENLGCTVVDLQLREKEHENAKLREELAFLRANNARLANAMQQRTQQLCDECNLHYGDDAEDLANIAMSINVESKDDPTICFDAYSDCIDRLSKRYKNERNVASKLQQNLANLQKQNKELSLSIRTFEENVAELQQNVKHLSEYNAELERSKQEMQARISQFNGEIELLGEQKFRLVNQLDSLATEYSSSKDNFKSEKIDFEQNAQKLEKELALMQESNEKLSQINAQAQKQIVELQQRNNEQDSAVKTLSDRLMKYQGSIEEQQSGVLLLKEQHEKLLVQCEQLKRNRRESDTHMESMHSQLSIKEMEMERLGTEITGVRQLNAELEQRIDELMQQYSMEKQASEATISNREEHIKQISGECEKLKSEVQDLKSANNQLNEELQNARQQTVIICELLDCAMEPEDNKLLANVYEKIARQIKQLHHLHSDAIAAIKSLEQQKEEINNRLSNAEQQLKCNRLTYEAEEQTFKTERRNSMKLQTKLENELQSLKDRFTKKETQLTEVIAEHNKLQTQLKQTSLELKINESNFVESILALKAKIDAYVADNIEFVGSCDLNNGLPEENNGCDRELLLATVDDNLKRVLMQSSSALNNLQQTVASLEVSIHEASEMHKQFQSELVAKETELRITLDEQQQERDDWQCKFSQLIRKITEQSTAQETFELTILDIAAVVESRICNIVSEPDGCDTNHVQKQQRLFEEESGETSTANDFISLRQLRQVLERVAMRHSEINDQNLELAKELQRQQLAYQQLQNSCDNKTRSAEQQLNEEVNRLNNEVRTLTEVNEQLGEECDALQERIAIAEQQIEKLMELKETTMRAQMEEQQKCIGLQEQHSKCDVKLLERESQLEQVRRQLQDQQKLLSEFESNTQRLQEYEQRDQQLEKELELATNEVQRLKSELTTATAECTRSNDELRECKRELQRANENVSQLIQQIGSIRQEKEVVAEEREQLRYQLDETGRSHSVCETRIKGIIERSQSLERQLQHAEDEIRSMRAQMITNEQSNERLAAENGKLREMQITSVKRIEELSLRVGESQARENKVDRELTEKIAAAERELQCERGRLQSECQKLRDKLVAIEHAHGQCDERQVAFEQCKDDLKTLRLKLEASEMDAKMKLSKLEKAREANDEKIRKLNVDLSNAESANVRLNLEIGALNSQLQEAHGALSVQRTEREERELEIAENTEKLQKQQQHAVERLTEASTELAATHQKCEKLLEELQQLQSELLIVRAEKSHVEESTSAKLVEFRAEQTSALAALKDRNAELEALVAKKDVEIIKLLAELEAARIVNEQILAAEPKTTTTCSNCSSTEGLRTQLSIAETRLEKEEQIIAQLRLDNQILQAKYRESKQRLQDESKSSEERIKENRLELEGKLEKMKNKMKTLYTEEIAKMKTKSEREAVNFKAELELLKAQNIKYEEYTRKLSNQIVRLNDQILEQQKQNAILTTKLKHVQEGVNHHDVDFTNEFGHTAMTSAMRATLPRTTSSTANTAATAVPNFKGSSNLTMEDEEGEVFNNTYLADLKFGRMPDHMSRDVCAEELQYRNSLLPPHLKSAYAAQYDYVLQEDDVKDGCLNNLDDSMSALLSSTNLGATRKKVSGATHYKRPGPPTPSKNGGRLSFGSGGNSEPPREILKESYDSGNVANSSSTKTPARFGLFASRFSLGGGGGGNGNNNGRGGAKDENTPPKRRLSNMFKRK